MNNDILRFDSHPIAEPGGGRVVTRVDFAVLADDGRRDSVTGFLRETVPA